MLVLFALSLASAAVSFPHAPDLLRVVGEPVRAGSVRSSARCEVRDRSEFPRKLC